MTKYCRCTHYRQPNSSNKILMHMDISADNVAPSSVLLVRHSNNCVLLQAIIFEIRPLCIFSSIFQKPMFPLMISHMRNIYHLICWVAAYCFEDRSKDERKINTKKTHDFVTFTNAVIEIRVVRDTNSVIVHQEQVTLFMTR